MRRSVILFDHIIVGNSKNKSSFFVDHIISYLSLNQALISMTIHYKRSKCHLLLMYTLSKPNQPKRLSVIIKVKYNNDRMIKHCDYLEYFSL